MVRMEDGLEDRRLTLPGKITKYEGEDECHVINRCPDDDCLVIHSPSNGILYDVFSCICYLLWPLSLSLS
jgi:hypothetical protein